MTCGREGGRDLKPGRWSVSEHFAKLTLKSTIVRVAGTLTQPALTQPNLPPCRSMRSTLPFMLDSLAAAADSRKLTRREWALKAGVRPETLSRLRARGDCNFATLEALAHAVGLRLEIKPERNNVTVAHMPPRFGREEEKKLLKLCSAPPPKLDAWSAAGPAFFMGGLAVMLASLRGFDREGYLALGEALHPGISTPETLALWLKQSPLRPSRFVPMLEQRRETATQARRKRK